MKNRKTLKKLILGGLLLLTTSSVFAQTQKVHTLQAKNSSGTTTMNSDALIQMDSDNKGLLLPRIALTGANQVAPLTAHTAGMVVYNTANVPASGTGATAIEAVTPGYYYNNGTKWVKISSTDQNEWSYNPTTKEINLVRSGTAPFANKVYFDENGKYINVGGGDSTYEEFSSASNTYEIKNPLVKDIQQNFTKVNTSEIVKQSTAVAGPYTFPVILNKEILNVDTLPTGTNSAMINISLLNLPRSNTQNFKSIYGGIQGVANSSSGTTERIIGNYSHASSLGTNTVSSFLVAGYNQATAYSSNEIKNIYVSNNFLTDRRVNGGSSHNMVANRNAVLFSSGAKANVTNLYGSYTYFRRTTDANPIIQNSYGIAFDGFRNVDGYIIPSVQNSYGLHINDVISGTVSNYAIYTKAGAVRFGDNVGIGTTTAPTEKLEVVGNGKFTGTVSTTGVLTTSDKRFKQGVTPVTSAIQTVNKLQPVSYTWSALGKKNGGDNKKHIGFIAQEVEKVLPNLVNTNAKGYKSVNYIEVIPVLTKALQEQQKAIEKQQRSIKKQQKEIEELKAMVKKLLK